MGVFEAPFPRPTRSPRFTAPTSFMKRARFLVFLAMVVTKTSADSMAAEGNIGGKAARSPQLDMNEDLSDGYGASYIGNNFHSAADKPEETETLERSTTPNTEIPESAPTSLPKTSPQIQSTHKHSLSTHSTAHLQAAINTDVDHSQDWNATTVGNIRILWNVRHNQQYVLYPRDDDPPSDEFKLEHNISSDAVFLQTPLTSIAVDDTTVAHYVEALGARDTISYMDITYVTSGCLRTLHDSGNIKQLTSIWSNQTKFNEEVETVDAIITGYKNPLNVVHQNKTILFTPTAESEPLGRSEWILFLAFFFDDEEVERAVDVFSGIKERYLCHQYAAQFQSGTKKVIAWLDSTNYPSSTYTIKDASYLTQLTTDAGAIMMTGGSYNASDPNETDAFHAALMDVDVVVDTSYYSNNDAKVLVLKDICAEYGISESQCNDKSNFNFLKNSQVIRLDGLVGPLGQDYFESAVLGADVLLEDVQAIASPLLQPNHEKTWLRNVALGEEIVEEPKSCPNSSAPTESRADGCPNYYQIRASADVSLGWSVIYGANYKHLTVEATGDTYLLYEKGTEPPNIYPEAIRFEIPLQRIAVRETVSATFIEMVNQTDKIVYMDMTYVTSPCLRVLHESGGIQQLAASGSDELVAQLQEVDALFGSRWDSDQNDDHVKTKHVVFGATADEGSRSEWVEFVSVFFNAESTGNEIFASMSENYDCLANGVRCLSTEGKTVAFISKSTWGGSTSYSISQAQYKKDLVNDAGGVNVVLADGDYGYYTDVVDLHRALANVSVVVDETYIFRGPDYLSNPTNLTDFCESFSFDDCSSISEFTFIAERQVYREDNRLSPNGNDWFESGVALKDMLLQNMIEVLNSNKSPYGLWSNTPGYNPVNNYLRNIADPEVQPYIPAVCPNPYTPRLSPAAKCAQGYATQAAEDSTPSDVNRVMFTATFATLELTELCAAAAGTDTVENPSREQFQLDYRNAVAASLNVNVDDVVVWSIEAGSVVVVTTVDLGSITPVNIALILTLPSEYITFGNDFTDQYGAASINVVKAPDAANLEECANTILAHCGDSLSGSGAQCTVYTESCGSNEDQTGNWCNGKCYAANEGDCCSKKSENNKAISDGIIAAIVVGALAAAALLSGAVYYFFCRSANEKNGAAVNSSVMSLDSVEEQKTHMHHGSGIMKGDSMVSLDRRGSMGSVADPSAPTQEV